MVQQCYKLILNGGSTIVMNISDDTDVFFLACNFFPVERSDVTVLMEPTKTSRVVADIGATVQKHKSIVSSLLAAYVLSGWDSACHYQGIGKKTVIKVLQTMQLHHLLNPNAAIEDVLDEATRFMGLCYGIENGSTMSEKRYMLTIISSVPVLLWTNNIWKSCLNLKIENCLFGSYKLTTLFLPKLSKLYIIISFQVQGLDEKSKRKTIKCT